MKNALKETAQRPRKRGIWHFFMICGWLLPQNHSPARRNLKIFRALKFVEHDLRTLFWAIFGAKVTPPGYPVGVGVPEKGHLGSGEMGHPNLDEKNGCWKILPASGLVWASQSLLSRLSAQGIYIVNKCKRRSKKFQKPPTFTILKIEVQNLIWFLVKGKRNWEHITYVFYFSLQLDQNPISWLVVNNSGTHSIKVIESIKRALKS